MNQLVHGPLTVAGATSTRAGTKGAAATPKRGRAAARFKATFHATADETQVPPDAVMSIPALLLGGTHMRSVAHEPPKRPAIAARSTLPLPTLPPAATFAKAAHGKAPPGKAPPGTAVSGKAPPDASPNAPPPNETVIRHAPVRPPAGQQSEISGHVLDAVTTAKELPARKTGDTAPQIHVEIATPVRAPSAPVVQAQPAAAHTSDLLGRMLSRAVRANGPVATKQATSIARSAHTASAPNADLAAAKLASLLTETSAGKHAIKRPSPSTPSVSAPNASSAVLPSAHAAYAPATQLPGAQAASVPAYAHVDPEAILSQIVRGISVRTIDGTQEVRLKLQPEHLGEIAMKLHVDGTTVNASFSAQNADVRDVIAVNQTQLARALSDAGMKLAGFSVDVSGGNARGFPNERDGSRHMGRRHAVIETTAATTESADTVTAGPALVSGVDTSLLDYLV